MSREIEDIMENWVTTDQGAELTGYTAEYMRILAREGKIEAQKMGRDWWIKRDALLAYKHKMDELGKQKHALWKERERAQ